LTEIIKEKPEKLIIISLQFESLPGIKAWIVSPRKERSNPIPKVIKKRGMGVSFVKFLSVRKIKNPSNINNEKWAIPFAKK